MATDEQLPPGSDARPRRRRRTAKTVGLVVGSVVGLFVVLAIVGSILGPPAKTAATAPLPSATSSPIWPQMSTSRMTSVAPTTSWVPTEHPTPTPAVHHITATPAPVNPGVQLTFSGGLSGQVSKAMNVQPIRQNADYNYTPPDWATQCVFPNTEGAWTADISFVLNGVTWEISIREPGFGDPKTGPHPALDQNVAGGSGADPNNVSVTVSSQQSPDGNPSAYADSYGYYEPMNHNNGTGSVTINSGLASGSIDVWLTPAMPENLEFQIKGEWSCT